MAFHVPPGKDRQTFLKPPSVVNQLEAVAPSRQPAGILRANTAIARAHVLQSVLRPLPGDLFTDAGNRPRCCWFAPSDRSCQAEPDQALIAKGEKIYADKKCAVCHMIKGSLAARTVRDGAVDR